MSKTKTPKTIPDIIKRELEERLTAAGIPFKRKQGGLRLRLFGSPEVYPHEDRVVIQLIAGTSGYSNTRDYSKMTFKFGDIADPNTDLQAVIDKVAEALGHFRAMEQLATGTIYIF